MFTALLLGACLPAADPAPPKADRDALKPFAGLVGPWRGTGHPEGTREERQKGFWTEGVDWEWRFKGDRAWLSAKIDKGKYFAAAKLEYVPDSDSYRLTLTSPDKAESAFVGKFADKTLTLDRTDEKAGEDQRVVLTLLHANRYLFRYESRPAGKGDYVRKYLVGTTKDDVPFAEAGGGPECIVSGGLGTMKVSYQGKDYYVCCGGCRDAFKEDPEKYVKAAAAKEKPR